MDFPSGSFIDIDRVLMLIGTFVDPFAGDIDLNTGGLLLVEETVVKVNHRRVQEEPSDAFTHQRYVVPYARPETEHVFVPSVLPDEDRLPILGRV